MRSSASFVVVLVVLALGCEALAGERGQKRARERPDRPQPMAVAGSLVAAEVEGDVVKLRIKTADAGEDKVVEMPASVAVFYIARGGQKRVINLRAAGKRPFQAKGNAQVAQGQFVKAVVEGDSVAVTVKVGEGEAAEEQTFTMPNKITAQCREKGGRLITRGITAARGARRPRKEKAAAGQ